MWTTRSFVLLHWEVCSGSDLDCHAGQFVLWRPSDCIDCLSVCTPAIKPTTAWFLCAFYWFERSTSLLHVWEKTGISVVAMVVTFLIVAVAGFSDMIHTTLIVTVSALTWRLRSAFKLLIFVCCPIICLYVLSSVLWLSFTISHIKTMFDSSLPPVVMGYLCHKWPRICSTCRKHFPVLSSFMTYHRVCN